MQKKEESSASFYYKFANCLLHAFLHELAIREVIINLLKFAKMFPKYFNNYVLIFKIPEFSLKN